MDAAPDETIAIMRPGRYHLYCAVACRWAPFIATSEEFDGFYRSERDKWAKVIKAAGMDKE